MSYETISLNIENRVATITINRPKMMNAFNEPLIWDMGDATEIVKNDSFQIVMERIHSLHQNTQEIQRC